MQFIKYSTSFIGRTDCFYVLRNEGLANLAIPKMYARYATVEAYNNRTEVPVYVSATEALDDFDREVKIYGESLTTTPPVYPPDRDNSDLGLTPAQHMWVERIARVKGSQRHAA